MTEPARRVMHVRLPWSYGTPGAVLGVHERREPWPFSERGSLGPREVLIDLDEDAAHGGR